jgi:hypothetical protein
VTLYVLVYVYVKVIPLIGRGGSQGCETSRLPYFLDSRLTDSGEAVNLTRRPSLAPGRFLVLISVRGWVDPRDIVRLKVSGQWSPTFLANKRDNCPVSFSVISVFSTHFHHLIFNLQISILHAFLLIGVLQFVTHLRLIVFCLFPFLRLFHFFYYLTDIKYIIDVLNRHGNRSRGCLIPFLVLMSFEICPVASCYTYLMYLDSVLRL